MHSKNCDRQGGNSNSDCSIVANPGVVQRVATTDLCTVLHPTIQQSCTNANGPEQDPPSSEAEIGSFCFIREHLQGAGLSQNTINIILQSWRKSTVLQYGTYFKKWVLFCDRQEINLLTASTTLILEFLTELFHNGLGYSTINTAKSSLSSFYNIIDGRNIGMEPLVQRFMKGVFTSKPALPKYHKVWPIKAVH